MKSPQSKSPPVKISPNPNPRLTGVTRLEGFRPGDFERGDFNRGDCDMSASWLTSLERPTKALGDYVICVHNPPNMAVCVHNPSVKIPLQAQITISSVKILPVSLVAPVSLVTPVSLGLGGFEREFQYIYRLTRGRRNAAHSTSHDAAFGGITGSRFARMWVNQIADYPNSDIEKPASISFGGILSGGCYSLALCALCQILVNLVKLRS